MAKNSEAFDKQRESCFAGVDLSRKGSIDTPIVDLVKLVNGQANYFTTSSCSGRIIVLEQAEGNQVKKKGCRWLFTCHDVIEHADLVASLSGIEDDAVFKFEPLVLHIQCRAVEDAQRLHACAVASGFRNSGITIGSKGKIITAVRSTHTLEVPLSQGKQLLVSDEYLRFLAVCANRKMRENFARIERFHQNFRSMLQTPVSAKDKKNRNQNEEKRTTKDMKEFSQCSSEGDNSVRSADNKLCQHSRDTSVTRRHKEKHLVLETDDGDIGTDFLFDNT